MRKTRERANGATPHPHKAAPFFITLSRFYIVAQPPLDDTFSLTLSRSRLKEKERQRILRLVLKEMRRCYAKKKNCLLLFLLLRLSPRERRSRCKCCSRVGPVLRCFGSNPSLVFDLVFAVNRVRLRLGRILLVWLVQESLNAEKDLFDGDCGSPILFLI